VSREKGVNLSLYTRRQMQAISTFLWNPGEPSRGSVQRGKVFQPRYLFGFVLLCHSAEIRAF
jgi:hypothetical protein